MNATDVTPKQQEKLLISEIYPSVQGESTWAGVPMTFVRLTGCPLRCVWCDTEYAFQGGEQLSFQAILEKVRALKLRHIEVTGGEPLAQEACYDLLHCLVDEGFTVLLETAGSHDLKPVDPSVHIIMDLKAPGSGEEGRNRWSNLEHLKPAKDEIKIVLADRTDYEWVRTRIQEHKLEKKAKAILLSPVYGKLDGKTLVEWILADGLQAPVRMQLQLHKQIWDPNTKSV